MSGANVLTNPAYFLLDGAFFQGPDYQELKHYTNVLLEHPSNTLVLTLTTESLDPDTWVVDFINLLKTLKNQRPNRKIFIILDEWYNTFNWDEITSLVDDVYFIDFFLVRSWLFYCHYKLVPTNNYWSPSSQEFLFLLGKPGKFNRIRLLHKLFQANLTKRGAWSLSGINSWHLDRIKEVLPELSSQELDEFLKAHSRILDRVYRGDNYAEVMPTVAEFKNLPKFTSFAFLAHDIQIYQNKLFAVVAETDFDRLFDHPRFTEKTWMHIIQHLPFIMAGESKSLEQLSDMGFDTFQDLLPIPNYDNSDSVGYLEPTTPENYFKHLIWQEDFVSYYNVIKEPHWPSLDTIEKNFNQYTNIVEECFARYQTPMRSDIEHRLNAIVTNIRGWLIDPQFTDDIKTRVEKNYKNFDEVGREKYNDYLDWTRGHQIESCHLDIIFCRSFSEIPNHEISTWLNANAT
jgi:hypothetical protein